MPVRTHVKIALILALSGLWIFSAYAAQNLEPFRGQVTGDDVNVRADSTVSSRALCRLARGQVVEVVSESYGWYRIRLPEQASAYIRKDMVVCIDKPAAGTVTPSLEATRQEAVPLAADPDKSCSHAKVIKNDVNIRLEPGETSWIIGRVQEDQLLNLLGESGNWYKIIPPDNSFGWVHKKFITKAAALPVSEKAVPALPARDVLTQDGKTGSIIISGMVQPYGRVFGIKAHHKLVTEDNKVFLLRGEKGSLNVLIGRKAKITGTLVGQKGTKFPVIAVRSVEAIK